MYSIRIFIIDTHVSRFYRKIVLVCDCGKVTISVHKNPAHIPLSTSESELNLAPDAIPIHSSFDMLIFCTEPTRAVLVFVPRAFIRQGRELCDS